jgi:hypothetical protein
MGLSTIPSSLGQVSPDSVFRYVSDPYTFRFPAPGPIERANRPDVFGCPDNIFFVAPNRSVWILPVWQAAQILMLLAQERFGPAFLYVFHVHHLSAYSSLTIQSSQTGMLIGYHFEIRNDTDKQLQPADSYNYHPLLPSSSPDAKVDPEAQAELSIEEKTCSICMEEVDTSPGPSGEVLLGMNRRRSYAVAPCHHLFHTKCLAQWLAIKVSEVIGERWGRLTGRRYAHCASGVCLHCNHC